MDIEGISVVFNSVTSGLTGGISASVAGLDSVSAAADVAAASLSGVEEASSIASATLNSLTASVSADGEAVMTLSDVMAQLNSMMTEQQVAVTSDGEAVVTLGAVLADLAAAEADAAAQVAIESDAAASAAANAAYLAANTATVAPALDATAASADTAAASLSAESSASDKSAVSAKGLQSALTVAGLAVAALGVVSVKMGGDFQASMTSLVTGAGESQKNIDMVSSGILKLADITGESTKELSDGMYMIESAGYHGAAGLVVLQAAAEGAKVGNASLADVANGVTTAMTDYASSNLTATEATNALIATVAAGKTHMADLANAFATILPTSSAVGVKFYDVSAAMATMTGEGVPAADAATYLRQMLMSLENPSKNASTVLSEIGLSSKQVADEMKISLPAALQLIEEHLAKKFPVGSQEYNAALAAISGGTKQMQGMLDLTGQHMSTFEQNLKNISGAVKSGGANIQGWAQVQGDFNTKVDEAREAVETLGIMIGTKLLPFLGPLIGDAASLVGKFTAWAGSGHAISDALTLTGKYAQIALPILAGLGALVLAVIVPAFWSWAAATLAATWPFLLIAGAVAGLTALFVHFYQTNAGFKSFIDGIASAFKQAGQWIATNFTPVMQSIGTFIQTYVTPILQELGQFIVSQFMPIWQQLQQLWTQQLAPALQQLWTQLQPLGDVLKAVGVVVGAVLVAAFVNFMGIIHGVISGVATMVSGITTAFGGIVQFITSMVKVFQGIGQFFDDLFHGRFGKLGADLQGIWKNIISAAQGFGTFFKGIFQATFGAIGSFISGFVQGALSTINTLITGADRAKIQAQQKADEAKIQAINTATQEATLVLAQENRKRQGILKELEETKDPKKRAELEMQLNAITNKEKETQQVITQENAKKEGVLKHLAELKQQEEEANKSIFQKVADWFGQAKDKAIQLFGQMKDGIGQKLTDFKNMVGGWFSAFGSFWHDRWTGITNAVGNIFSGVGGFVRSALNSAISAVNGFIRSLDSMGIDAGPIHIHPSIPQIPYLASGGSVAPGMWAVVGDRGPELAYGGSTGLSVLSNANSKALLSSNYASQQQTPVVVHNHNQIFLDSQELTDIVGPQIVQRWLAQSSVKSAA